MERMLAQEMGGSIEIDYAPTGLHATIVLALGTTPADAARRDGSAVDAPPEPQTPPRLPGTRRLRSKGSPPGFEI